MSVFSACAAKAPQNTDNNSKFIEPEENTMEALTEEETHDIFNSESTRDNDSNTSKNDSTAFVVTYNQNLSYIDNMLSGDEPIYKITNKSRVETESNYESYIQGEELGSNHSVNYPYFTGMENVEIESKLNNEIQLLIERILLERSDTYDVIMIDYEIMIANSNFICVFFKWSYNNFSTKPQNELAIINFDLISAKTVEIEDIYSFNQEFLEYIISDKYIICDTEDIKNQVLTNSIEFPKSYFYDHSENFGGKKYNYYLTKNYFVLKSAAEHISGNEDIRIVVPYEEIADFALSPPDTVPKSWDR